MSLTAPTADLTGNTISDTYDQLLILDNAAGLVENTLKIVSTQTGRSALQLDDEKILIKGVDTSNAAVFDVQNTGGTSIFKVNASTVGATLIGTLAVGSAGAGHDVTFYSATSGDQMAWDASEEVLNITGTNGQTALDVLDGDIRVVDKIYLYDRGGEHISSDGTALSLQSGEDINLSCLSGDVNIPVNIGLRFGDGNQHIETNNVDFTITSDVSINLNSPQVDLIVDTNFVTTGGTNGMSIDGTTFSVDGFNNRIGIGTATPATKLEVVGSFTTGLVTIAATDAITAAEHAGRTNLLGEVGGNALVTLTLPDATGTGNVYKFTVSVVNTSSYKFLAPDADNTIDGQIMITDADGTAATSFVTAATTDTIILNGTTSGGGAIGDYIELTDIAANQWAVNGMVTCAAGSNIATMFSATVS